MDASVSFERCWNEYVDGFGDVDGNFWLGLEAIHTLTDAEPMSLQIDIVPFNIPAVSIPYQQIHVGDAASEYLLTISSRTSGFGTLYTSMNYHSGSKFSTYDRDNSNHSSQCSVDYRTGWWFQNCCMVCLNGVYGGGSAILSSNMRMRFLSSNPYEPIRTVTMKIRAID